MKSFSGIVDELKQTQLIKELIMWNPTEEDISKKFRNHKNNASQRGIKCSLTLDEFTHVIHSCDGICDYTGMTMCWSDKECKDGFLTIERINSHDKYSLHNILIVRRDVNLLKSQLLETKTEFGVKGTLSVETKEMLNKICEVVYNPIRLQEVQAKYLTKKDNIKLEESTKEIKTTNPEIKLAQGYAGLGKLVESVSTFELTYAQYKAKMNYKKCELTGEKFNKGDVKSFWWVDKTKPFNKDNVMLTNKKLSESLDNFMVSGGLSLTALKHLCKIISLK